MAHNYEARLQEATLALGTAIGASPLEPTQLNTAFEGIEEAVQTGVTEQRLTPHESLAKLSEFAGLVATAARDSPSGGWPR